MNEQARYENQTAGQKDTINNYYPSWGMAYYYL